MPPEVASALLTTLAGAEAGPELEDNVDFVRFPDGMEDPPGSADERLAYVLGLTDGLQFLYERLDEPGDRELLLRLLAYGVLGHRRVQLPMTADRLRALVARAASARVAAGTAPLGIPGWQADDFDLRELGFSVRLRAHVGNVVQTFLLEQYRCPGRLEIAVQPGDVVVDGGACFGDTALYFAQLAGPTGRVAAFEFEPANLALLEHNLAINPELGERVTVERSALWERAGERIGFRPLGPATALDPDAEASVPTDSVDALVERAALPRVDFLKLDVEGSELSVLRGAEATLRRFRPRLAIAGYHRGDDLVTLPRFIAGLGCGYRLRLAHTTMHREETMLFAAAV